MMIDNGRSGAGAPSGCQPSASAADASSQSGIPNADRRAAARKHFDCACEAMICGDMDRVHRELRVVELFLYPRKCPHGHEFTPENTAFLKSGERWCRECGRRRARDYQRRKREASR